MSVDPGDLGAFKFSRGGKSTILVFALLALVALGFAALCWTGGGGLERAGSVALVAVAAALVWGGVILSQVRSDFYEHGLRRRTRDGEQVVRWDEVEALVWSTPIAVNGQPQSRLELYTREGRPLVLALAEVDREIYAVRDDLTRRLARLMQERLVAAGRVEWVKGLWLTPRGVFLESTAEELAFPDVALPIATGTMKLTRAADKKILQKVSCAEKNFYPGLMLLERLRSDLAPTRGQSTSRQ